MPDLPRMYLSNSCRDKGAPVSALCVKSVMTQSFHQLDKHPCTSSQAKSYNNSQSSFTLCYDLTKSASLS